ncbi:DUF5655 domain-containing protein [Tenggerimyces flavus]|uniref:DUF5655 domain-containing protein n=1 Tax=Tenggerimyces flavus TaxID=1708749 RepID=A0ABV7YN48_9ACTN|nr:DUF5655 domain-containing protein [Tenggerimyces flavus]MBM7784805.1 hypothetical protein [Tenggerimyces flavus]
MSLEEYFSTGDERERAIFEAVYAHVRTLGPVQVEPVSVGIFIKRSGSYLELRPKTKWVALSFGLDRTVTDERIARKVVPGGTRWHFVNLRGPEDVDDVVKGWLTEAYLLK